MASNRSLVARSKPLDLHQEHLAAQGIDEALLLLGQLRSLPNVYLARRGCRNLIEAELKELIAECSKFVEEASFTMLRRFSLVSGKAQMDCWSEWRRSGRRLSRLRPGAGSAP